MPRSATGASRAPAVRPPPRRQGSRRAAGGFTLIEILVVVVIVSVLSGFVLLALGRAGPASINERAVARIDAAMSALCDRALLTGRTHGIRFHDGGYDFWALGPAGWVELADGDPPSGRWPETGIPRLRVAAARAELDRAAAPQVVCTGIEPATPFELRFGLGDSQRELVWP